MVIIRAVRRLGEREVPLTAARDRCQRGYQLVQHRAERVRDALYVIERDVGRAEVIEQTCTAARARDPAHLQGQLPQRTGEASGEPRYDKTHGVQPIGIYVVRLAANIARVERSDRRGV